MHDFKRARTSTNPLPVALQAIGQRLLVEAEKENRSKREAELRARIEERNAELRRLNVELESLLKVEAEQREALEKLGNNEPAGI